MLFGDHFYINYVIWPPYEDIKPLAHLSSTHVDGSDATRMISIVHSPIKLGCIKVPLHLAHVILFYKPQSLGIYLG